MHIVRRRVDDRLDLAIGQHHLVACGRPAAVFCCELISLFLGAGVAAENRKLARALDGVGQNIRPPSNPDAGHAQRTSTHDFRPPAGRDRSFVVSSRTRPLAYYFQLSPIDSTAALAMRKSVSQSPPLTPTPPIHWPSTSTGTPPSMAVHRSGPAASARPSAWLTSRS